METVLITGANGEIGHGLIPNLAKTGKYEIIALDIREIDPKLRKSVKQVVIADINDEEVLHTLLKDHKITTIFHLAAILSTGAEKDPELAVKVNAKGSEKILDAANKTGQTDKRKIKIIFPSSIAVYGLPGVEIKKKAGKVTENQFLNPITIYGITKLYCENLGKYYSNNYKLLSDDNNKYVDFRCIRFPGIISALTLPTGGTSDYAPEMIHSAAQGTGYESFVRPDTKIPFMVMPDAVSALIKLNETPAENLKRRVYNVEAFSVSAGEISDLINQVFPDSSISYNPEPKRQKIVDSWPESVDDTPARSDWGWQPEYDLGKSFNQYLIPEIRNKYK